jgi:pyrroloquinoline quinone biosynthesis protein D
MISPEDTIAIAQHLRLQWEPAQNAWVLLYPEGMVRLSESAGEIMKRIDGTADVQALITGLEHAFPGADLRADVLEFLEVAVERGWITRSSPR